MNRHDIDEMWANWQVRMTPTDPRLKQAQWEDPWYTAQMEMVRRAAHHYQEAMELEGVPEETRRRVLSMVLLGSPDGLDILARQHLEQLYKDALSSKLPPIQVFDTEKWRKR